jgi:FecR protein
MKKIILCLLIVSLNCYGAIGSVTEQTATVGSIVRSSKTMPAAKGAGVEMNDTVNTTKGKVGITFEDETKVEVNENSKLVIDDFVYDAKSSKGGKLAMRFASGTVRYASGAIAHNNPNAVALNTPSATIAVRGTDFTATVDEVGASTIILLPSCPKVWVDIDRDCKTGVIDVINEAGMVTLNKPFQGTKVMSRNMPPMKPTTLNLTADTINNLLIVSPPKELDKDKYGNKNTVVTNPADMLAVNFLKQDYLKNELASQTPFGDDPLSQPLLQQYFLEDIFDILAQQLQDEQTGLLANLLAPQNTLLPDYKKSTGVVSEIGTSDVSLCRSDGSNMQCVTVPKDQNSTIYQQQGSVNIKNRVNAGGNTIITLKQN